MTLTVLSSVCYGENSLKCVILYLVIGFVNHEQIFLIQVNKD